MPMRTRELSLRGAVISNNRLILNESLYIINYLTIRYWIVNIARDHFLATDFLATAVLPPAVPVYCIWILKFSFCIACLSFRLSSLSFFRASFYVKAIYSFCCTFVLIVCSWGPPGGGGLLLTLRSWLVFTMKRLGCLGVFFFPGSPYGSYLPIANFIFARRAVLLKVRDKELLSFIGPLARTLILDTP